MLTRIIMTIIICAPLAAQEYFISPTGNNGWAGTTEETAWASLYHASLNMQAGDTLTILDGTYAQMTTTFLQFNGTAENPTVIRAKNKWGAQFVVDDSWPLAHHWTFFNIYDSSHVIIDGLKMHGKADRDQQNSGFGHGIFIGGSHHVTVRNCWIEYMHGGGINGTSYFSHPNGGQIVVRVLDHILVENNFVSNCAWYAGVQTSGISFYQPRDAGLGVAPGGFNFIIRNNTVWGCENKVNTSGFTYEVCAANGFVGAYAWNSDTNTDGNGIIIDDFRLSHSFSPGYNNGNPYPYKTLIENNVIFDNGGRGIAPTFSDNVTVRNNTMWGNSFALPAGYIGQMCNNFGSNNHYYNNIVVDTPNAVANGSAAIFVGENAEGVTFANNLVVGEITVVNNYIASSSKAVIEASSIIVEDAGLVAPGTDFATADFSLKSDSPAIDTGSSANGHFASLDFLGRNRPQGAGLDIGAYEHEAAIVLRSIIMQAIDGYLWDSDEATDAAVDGSSGATTLSGIDPTQDADVYPIITESN